MDSAPTLSLRWKDKALEHNVGDVDTWMNSHVEIQELIRQVTRIEILM